MCAGWKIGPFAWATRAFRAAIAALLIPAGVAQTYTFTTIAGRPGVPGSADGAGTAARFNHPGGIAADSSGNLYVADTDNHTIRKIASSGVVTTMAGSPGISGSLDGTGTSARFYGPSGIATDDRGTVYISDLANRMPLCRVEKERVRK